MNFYKLYAFLLVALVFSTGVAAQTKTPDVKDALTPELKRDALELLSAVSRETGQFGLPENRVRAQTIAADLMWEHDEQAARSIFQNAFGELQNMFANVNLPEGAELTSAEKSKFYAERWKLAELRKDFVLTLAGRDTQSALDAFAALKPPPFEENDPLEASDLELRVTTAIVKTNPDKSYEFAREQLAANGITYQFIEALKSLHKKDAKLAAALGRDVLAKFKSAKIRIPSADLNSTNLVPVNRKTEIDSWQISTFINAATDINRPAERDKTKKMLPLLTEAEMKETIELLANAFLAERNPAQYSISQIMREIARYAPPLVQRIRLKIGAEASRQLDKIVESNSYYSDTREKSAEELAKIADVSAPESRDLRYSVAAFKALEENEPEKAQAIAARIKDRKNYAYLFDQIQTAVPLAKARRGDLEAVRRMLATLQTNEERVATLTELAAALAAKGEKETAKTLLDESLQMMPALVRKQLDLEAFAKVAGVYAVAEPERSFSMLESGIGQMNRYIDSGIRMDEFYTSGAVERDELLFNSINKQVLMYVPNAADLMKNLGRADFERTVSLADKFERPEIRLFVRLRIAQSLLDEKAAEKEKKDRRQLVGGDEF